MDRHGRLDRWRLRFSNYYITVVYIPGLVNEVHDALLRCTPDDRIDAEVEDEFPTFRASVPALTTANYAEQALTS